jgi:taurine dioxygenase
MSFQTISPQPITGSVGAEVTGVDIASGLTEGQAGEIRAALGEFGVLVFREQFFSPDDHLAFADALGEVNVNRFFTPVESHPRIAEVRKEADQSKNIGGRWHTDHSYDVAPAMGSLLYARELPPTGGDTQFASTAAAYDALSQGMKDMLLRMRAEHSSRHAFGEKPKQATDDGERFGNAHLATQDATHPVIIRHPLTGRACIYVNGGFTLRFAGWTDEESKPLLDFLYAHIARPEFTCRIAWQPGTLVFWDNRCTWHMALNDYHGHRRLMHRITLEGSVLAAA